MFLREVRRWERATPCIHLRYDMMERRARLLPRTLVPVVCFLLLQTIQRPSCSHKHQQRKCVNLNEHQISPALTGTQPSSDIARIPVTIDGLLEMRMPLDLDMSADGKRVACVVAEYVPGKQKHRQRIWVTETEQGEARPFLNGQREETCPRWSPDGKHLAFLTRPEGEKTKPQIHLVPAEGGTPQILCIMPNGVSNLAWAPDGSCISFLTQDGDTAHDDPKVIQPARPRRLWIVRPDQALPAVITPENLTIREYTWAPDSTQLAVYYSEGPEETDWYHSHIGVVAATGGAIRKVVHLSLPARSLAWSPDGEHLAYLSGKWSDPGRGAGDIFLVSLINGQVRNLTPGIACSPAWCCWLPDGRELLYTAIQGLTHQVSLLEVASGITRVLVEDFVMQWDQPQLRITPDRRRCATIHSTGQQPYDIWSGTLNVVDGRATGMTWMRCSRLSPLIEETWEITPTERISYISSDGRRIEGLFTPPARRKENRLPPLYVEVHGGPSGADSDRWHFTTHIFTAHGYAVLRPNYRGSWGYGAAFAEEVIGDMGGKDLQDILSGVEYLTRQGLVDGKRVCIGGWSNGGFLSAWAITQTSRFKAAMVGAGVTDWYTMHAQTNIPDADVLLLAADPQEDSDAYRRCSPVTYVSRVTTPTLLLHGENDPVVPVTQAYIFYRALRKHNIPVECVIYPREGHGAAEHDHLYDIFERQLRWFETYVK